ncbi:PhoD-like phosphatase-domain-containing protein [Mycena rosella]|uniref:PhoD-like phosphatase-domain-containing protein n=1 Tax=Mycena rosella TaxID=1033263 RepID=A0AAD7GC17_MYCRO|nr:PhoD-like phosphatase-domain-containing protein [Mycena rosella]
MSWSRVLTTSYGAPMMADRLLWATSAASAVYLRATAFLFVRMLPLGYRFMPKISGAFVISLASFTLSRQHVRSPPSARTSALWSTLPILFGTYSRRNPLASFAGLLLNILAFIACMDFIYRAHILHPSESLAFSRTGYVDSNSARIVLRDPAARSQSQFSYRASTSSETETIPVPALTEDSDYTATLELIGLISGIRYFYNTTGAHAGSFVTSAAALKKFTMISTSCQKPFYPYSPLAHSLAMPGLSHLARYVESTPPEFILFLGDFIYSDLPMQIEPLTTRFYRQLYRQIYASPSWTRTLRDLPWIHVFDDHELINDYYPNMAGGEDMYSRAMDPFEHYQRAANPPRADHDGRKTYTQFRRGDASFFILDTRTYRATPPAKASGGSGSRTMLGAEQLGELLWWIDAEDGWKVVVSGVPMTRNWSEGGDEMDSWAGYLDEREVIFQALWRVGGGVIVSGDRHEHAAFPESHTIIEFSTSPLSFFYQPFLREYVSHDETIFNLPQGSSKFGQLTFDSSDEKKWMIGFELVVDGEKAWEYEHVWSRNQSS